MKHLMLLNPRGKKARKKSRGAKRDSKGRFLKRGSVKRKKSKGKKKTALAPIIITAPSMKKKYRKKSVKSNKRKRKVIRRRRKAIRRRTYRRVMQRRFRSYRFTVERRRKRKGGRRRKGRGGRGLKGLLSGIKGGFSKDMIITAAGATAGFLVTQIIIRKWGANLPGLNSTNENTRLIANIAWGALIPVALGVVIRKQNARLAEGFMLAGVISVTNAIADRYIVPAVNNAVGGTTAGVSEYLDYTPVAALNAPANYDAIGAFSGPLSTESAFPKDAWA